MIEIKKLELTCEETEEIAESNWNDPLGIADNTADAQLAKALWGLTEQFDVMTAEGLAHCLKAAGIPRSA